MDVWLTDGNFFYRYEEGKLIFGYHALRRAFREALARAMGFLNGREVVGVRVLRYTTKTCQFDVRVSDIRYRACGKKAEVAIVMKTVDSKYFAFYLCREHLRDTLELAKTHLVKSLASLVDGIEKALSEEDEEGGRPR